MNEVARCTGHCCEDFTLPISPMQLKWWAKLISLSKKPAYMKYYTRRSPGAVQSLNCGMKSHFNIEELKKIAEMVIFLRFDKHDNAAQNAKGKMNTVYHYTCKHFDRATGNCTNYENRPDMCRMYPNSGTCRYKGCTRVCEKPCEEKQSENTL